MVLVANSFCMDLYEASRPDATATSEGTKTTAARNRKGVLPWQMSWLANPGDNLKEARKACKDAGKVLCKLSQWITACEGPKKLVYSYGNTYQADTCNGIDKYCYCNSSPCKGVKPCPYTYCELACGADFKVDPTGNSPGCKNHWGVYDVTGNVWELTDSTDGKEHFRGGAYNCGDSVSLHRCDHDGTWGPSARGFRCCAPPSGGG
jgi:hypothetical protein